ncbi:hypothetical protein B0A69_14550 [Chryseobacterium shigense]|uniref:HEPN AbiU2-like domain-containing protein n=1 Tax=Chryseobacterium shigense TaxID=297244 RepID=A0A1N7JE87_9FLAO|nr:hypothetical protein [Chryseobacterium shigense]PQA92679.1 hypothetical protein B0A69_14550 [Chryseobacterium shigense]SIS47683.1 hypothetical protein SAMN05421639_106101 [Chryseobacterium shigense]
MNEIKKVLFEYFLNDARDYLLRYNQLEESATHIGLRSKLVIELMFSLECSLKALFIFETELDEKRAYEKIKKLSHNIQKIVDNLTQNSKNEFNRLITIDFDNYKVFHRYMFESEMAFREEFGVLGEKYYNTINNPQWRKSFYNGIQSFIKYVETKIPFEFKMQSFSDTDFEKEISKYNRLKNIIS